MVLGFVDFPKPLIYWLLRTPKSPQPAGKDGNQAPPVCLGSSHLAPTTQLQLSKQTQYVELWLNGTPLQMTFLKLQNKASFKK